MRTSLAVVLAAGEGKRMRSRLPKVLHQIGRLPMIAHVLKALQAGRVSTASPSWSAGPRGGREARRQAHAPGAIGARAGRAARHGARGAGGARGASKQAPTMCSSSSATRRSSRAAAISRAAREARASGASVVVGGMRPADPSGYGRLIDAGRPARRDPRGARRERGGARRSASCNGGIMALAGDDGARHPRRDRRRERPEGILSDRRGRDRATGAA